MIGKLVWGLLELVLATVMLVVAVVSIVKGFVPISGLMFFIIIGVLYYTGIKALLAYRTAKANSKMDNSSGAAK